jgi:histidinol-phosphate phosphatase family protein
MRILFASSLRGWGGGEEWFTRAARALTERGHDVRLAARRASTLARRAGRRGVRVVEVDYGGLPDPRAAIQLAQIISDQGTEIALANLDKEMTALALATLSTPRVALLMRRGSDFPAKTGPLSRWIFRHRAGRILVNSPAIRDTLVNDGLRIPDQLIELLPNGLEEISLTPSAVESATADWPAGPGPRLIVVAEVTDRKNPLGVLAALARIERPWRLLWIGGGDLLPAARQRAQDLGIEARVRFLGAVENARLWTACAHLLILYSKSEGQPWSVLEAMVQGVPVVTSHHRGLETLVEDGVSGRAVESGDSNALAKAVAEFLEDPSAARQWAEIGRQRVIENNAEGPVYDRLERILETARINSLGRRRAVFLDRDGTLTAEVGPVTDPAVLRLLPGVGPALRSLRSGDFELVVITNQAAIGRGQMTTDELRCVNARLRTLLRLEGVELAGILHCPHRPEDGCDCRKPEPGLLRAAARQLRVRLDESWMIGDSTRDTGAATRAGVGAVMVSTGWAGGDPRAADVEGGPSSAKRVADLQEAAEWILSREPA